MEQLDEGIWRTTIEVTAAKPADLIKKAAAVTRLLKKLDAENPKPRRARGEGSLYRRKRDGMWVGRIDLPPALDGSRTRSRPVYSKDHAEVIKKLAALKDDAAKGRPQPSMRLTVKAYLADWIETIAPSKVGPSALRGYRATINTRIIPSIGNKTLATLSPDEVRYMHKWISEAISPQTKKPYSTRAIEEAHNVLSGALDDAKSSGKIHDNPCRATKKPKVLSRSHGDLSASEARRVLTSALEAGDPMVTRWATGLMVGGRQGEVLGLQWPRIDLERCVFNFEWQLDWLKLKDGADMDDPGRFDVPKGFKHIPLWRGAALTEPKTEKSKRIVPIPDPLAAILTVYRDRATANPWDLVWVAQPRKNSSWKVATPVGDSVDRNAWKAAQLRAGIAAPVDVHAMRGTTATLLMEAGVDARIIQEILGHSSVTTTRGYQTVDLTAARRSLGELAPLLEIT